MKESRTGFPLVLIWVALVGIHTWFASRMVGPLILDDEFGYLANAAYLAGIDWSAIVRGMTHYSFGYSLFLVPGFLVLNDPWSVYQWALFVNALCASSVFLIAYAVGRRLAPEETNSRILLVALATVLYPSLLVYSNLAWAECALTFFYWISVLVSFHLFERVKSSFWCATFGVIVGGLYAIHPRSLAVVASASLLILLLRWVGIISWRGAALTGGTLLSCVGGAYVINKYLQAHLWLGAVKGNRSAARLLDLSTEESFWGFVRKLFGQIYYLGAASYLLVFMGLAIGLWIVVRGFKTRWKSSSWTKESLSPRDGAVVYVVATFLSAALLSALALKLGNRADHIFYGRYNEAFVGPLILIALLSLSPKRHFRTGVLRNFAIAAGGFAALALALSGLMEDDHLSKTMYTISITGVFPFKTETWQVDIKTIFQWVLPLALSVWLLSRWRYSVGVIGIAALFLWVGHSNMTGHLNLAARSLGRNLKIPAWLIEHAVKDEILYLRAGNSSDLKAEKYQFRMLSKRIIPVADMGSINSSVDYLISHRQDVRRVFPHARLAEVERNRGQFLWVLNREEQVRLSGLGLDLLDPGPRLLPLEELGPDEYRSDLELSLPDRGLVFNRERCRFVKSLRLPWVIQEPLGTVASVDMSVVNRSRTAAWPGSVRVGVVWFSKGGARKRVREHRAYLPSHMEPVEKTRVEVRLNPVGRDGLVLPPGEYEVMIGMVHENVCWFYERGDEVIRLPVLIE